MSNALETLRDQLSTKLADPDRHGSVLKAVLEIVSESGSEGLKKQVQQWIGDIKAKEGV